MHVDSIQQTTNEFGAILMTIIDYKTTNCAGWSHFHTQGAGGEGPKPTNFTPISTRKPFDVEGQLNRERSFNLSRDNISNNTAHVTVTVGSLVPCFL